MWANSDASTGPPSRRPARSGRPAPGWLRAATAGEYHLLGAHATVNGCKVPFDFTNHVTPVNGPGHLSMAGMLGWAQGGPAGSLNPSPRRLWTRPHGVARSIRLPDGHPATFHLNWGIRWRQGA